MLGQVSPGADGFATDLFLSHNWGTLEDGVTDNHERVGRINAALRRRGWRTWFDEQGKNKGYNQGEMQRAMAEGIEATQLVRRRRRASPVARNIPGAASHPKILCAGRADRRRDAHGARGARAGAARAGRTRYVRAAHAWHAHARAARAQHAQHAFCFYNASCSCLLLRWQ